MHFLCTCPFLAKHRKAGLVVLSECTKEVACVNVLELDNQSLMEFILDPREYIRKQDVRLKGDPSVVERAKRTFCFRLHNEWRTHLLRINESNKQGADISAQRGQLRLTRVRASGSVKRRTSLHKIIESSIIL